MTDPAETVRIGVVSQEANSQSIVDRTQGFLDKMVELIGEGKVSIIGHDKFKKEVADAKVILEIGIPAVSYTHLDVYKRQTVGCGDSMVAAFAVGFERGYSLEEALKYAVAVSAANTLTVSYTHLGFPWKRN